MVEHRYSTRKEAAVDVLLFQRDSYLAPGVIRNISQTGVFVETGATLPRNSFLELRFAVRDHHESKPYRLPAIVVHKIDRGMGLHVDTVTNDVQDSMRVLLQPLGGFRSLA